MPRPVDVGGGSVDNETPHSLARIALRWMIRECFKTETGIMFTSEGLRSVGLDPASLYPQVLPRPAPSLVSSSHLQHIPSAAKQKEKSLQHYAEGENLVDIVKTEEEHELLDAMAPVYDQLDLAWFWWLLEMYPMKQRYQRGDNSWGTYYGWNLGRGRFIPKQRRQKIKIHRSVKMRMDAQYPDGNKYVPRASFEVALEHGNVEWVD
jgi:hypothetical protein